jgi:hypothetical protein
MRCTYGRLKTVSNPEIATVHVDYPNFRGKVRENGTVPFKDKGRAHFSVIKRLKNETARAMIPAYPAAGGYGGYRNKKYQVQSLSPILSVNDRYSGVPK